MEAVERSRARRALAAGCTAALAAAVGLGIAATTDAPIAAAGPLCRSDETTVPLTADAKVSSEHPNRRYGRRGTWKVNYGPATTRTYFTFDLPAKPLGCQVVDAALDLRGRYLGRPSTPTEYPGAAVDMWLVERRWSERKITWNNRPRANGCDAGSSAYAQPDEWAITALVQKAYSCVEDGTLASFQGLKLRGWSPSGRGAHWRLRVNSRESSHPPMVRIIWG